LMIAMAPLPLEEMPCGLSHLFADFLPSPLI
jgi:hypothetical protein